MHQRLQSTAEDTEKLNQLSSKTECLFGFEVYCGPIQGEILIHSDELVRNGANYNIEVHRLGIMQ